jgi:hypothetical protein
MRPMESAKLPRTPQFVDIIIGPIGPSPTSSKTPRLLFVLPTLPARPFRNRRYGPQVLPLKLAVQLRQ